MSRTSLKTTKKLPAKKAAKKLARPHAIAGAAKAIKSRTADQPRRQDDMADAAASVFASKGFHGASTQDIAAMLGIRQASLYYYFKSKEDALRIVCEKGAAGFHEAAQAIVNGNGTSREKLAALITAHLEPLNDRADYVRVFLRERQHLPKASRKTINALALAIEGCFEAIIADGMRHGAFSPSHNPRLAGLAVLAMVNAVPFWKESKGVPIADVARQIVQIALGGLTGIAWYSSHPVAKADATKNISKSIKRRT